MENFKTAISVFIIIRIILELIMDPPAIIHSQNCCCPDCSWQPSCTHTSNTESLNARSPVEENARTVKGYSTDYVVMCVIVSVSLGFAIAAYFYSSGGHYDPDAAIFKQDLNEVQINFGKHPIDPKVIEAVHHWQRAPFGRFQGESVDVSKNFFEDSVDEDDEEERAEVNKEEVTKKKSKVVVCNRLCSIRNSLLRLFWIITLIIIVVKCRS